MTKLNECEPLKNGNQKPTNELTTLDILGLKDITFCAFLKGNKETLKAIEDIINSSERII